MLDRVPTDLEGLWICGVCAGLFGKPHGIDPQHERGDQRCSCRRNPSEPKWDRFDFNEYVHLCECCLQEALQSGSKFSVWFCQECKDRVVSLNDDLRVWLIPIGRHSFQARTYDPPGYLMLSGSVAASPRTPEGEAEIRRFCDATLGLFSSMEPLHAWSKSALLQNLSGLGLAPGTDARLPDYLDLIRARAADDGSFSKEAAFERLRDHMLDGSRPSSAS